MAVSTRTYIETAVTRLETMLNCQFSLHNSPMAEALHPELDDSPLLDASGHTKFRSLVGCANWLTTLGRFDIAYAVNSLSRFSQAPSQGHLEAMKRVFGYLKKWSKGAIMIDPKYPDHAQFNVETYDQWQEFYPDIGEMKPPPDMVLKPLGPKVRITVYKDTDRALDLVTRRSVSGILLFLTNTPYKVDLSKTENCRDIHIWI